MHIYVLNSELQKKHSSTALSENRTGIIIFNQDLRRRIYNLVYFYPIEIEI